MLFLDAKNFVILFYFKFMLFTTLISHSAELLRIILKSTKAPDNVATEYFRQKKYIGSKDRKFIAETVFNALRIKHSSDYIAEISIKSLKLENQAEVNASFGKIAIMASLVILEYLRQSKNLQHGNLQLSSPIQIYNSLQKSCYSINELIDKTAIDIGITEKSLYNTLNEQVQSAYSQAISCTESIYNLFSLPEYFSDKFLSHNRSIEEIKSIAQSVIYPAPLGIRVNNRMASTDSIINYFDSIGIEAQKSKISPAGLIINQRIRLNELEPFINGLIEVQDIGSQLISFALGPEQNSSVLDACAGAGGKSIHIADLQNDSGYILSSDIEFHRLKEIKGRAEKSGLKSISTQLIKNNDLHKSIHKKFDYVLIDAPCSGTGTMRRNPLPKINLNDKLLKKLNINQYNILQYYSQFTADGGILLYSTCSIMYEENEEIVKKFLENNLDFEPVPLLPVFEAYGVQAPHLQQNDFSLRLEPDNYESDGFFMARMRKIL